MTTSARQAAWLAASLLILAAAAAGDDEIPDVELLEYLGSWEESDEDWLIFKEPVVAGTDERDDPAPDGEESTEKSDEEG